MPSSCFLPSGSPDQHQAGRRALGTPRRVVPALLGAQVVSRPGRDVRPPRSWDCYAVDWHGDHLAPPSPDATGAPIGRIHLPKGK